MSEYLTLDSKQETNVKEAKKEITAEWRIPIKGRLHKIEFEHGTASGKRVLWINDKVNEQNTKDCVLYKCLFHSIIKEIFRRDWMFKLVGDDIFTLDDMKCVIRVNII